MENPTTSFKYEIKYTHIFSSREPMQVTSNFENYDSATESFKSKAMSSADHLQLVTGTINIMLFRVRYENDIVEKSDLLKSITLTSTISV
jgi:hypothetical protein